MGKEYNDMKKRAVRMLTIKLSETQHGLSIEEMTRTMLMEFGLGKRFVLDYLDNFGDAIEEKNGLFKWKA